MRHINLSSPLSSLCEETDICANWHFCREFNSKQLLFKTFFHIICIFGNIEPLSQSISPFPYIIIVIYTSGVWIAFCLYPEWAHMVFLYTLDCCMGLRRLITLLKKGAFFSPPHFRLCLPVLPSRPHTSLFHIYPPLGTCCVHIFAGLAQSRGTIYGQRLVRVFIVKVLVTASIEKFGIDTFAAKYRYYWNCLDDFSSDKQGMY